MLNAGLTFITSLLIIRIKIYKRYKHWYNRYAITNLAA